jgi:ParB-like nuclease family protein
MSAYRSNGGTLVPLAEVRVDATWQSPLYLEDEKVKRFVDLMQKGCELPPIKVSEKQGGCYVVREGHHRFVASQKCSFTHIPVEIIPRPSTIAR